jgi:hypothetical protein
MLTEDDHMIKIIIWDGQQIVMEVCEACGIGSGVTRYPDMAYQHAQATLREGLCDDCFRAGAAADTGGRQRGAAGAPRAARRDTRLR